MFEFLKGGVVEMWATDLKKREKRPSEQAGSLESVVLEKRKQLEEQRKGGASMREEAFSLRREAEGIHQPWLQRKRKETIRRAEKLEEEAAKVESGFYVEKFDALSARYISEQEKRFSGFEKRKQAKVMSVPGGKGKGDQIDEYVVSVDKNRSEALLNEFVSEVEDKPPRLAIETRDVCPMCSEKMTLLACKSIMTCTSCGYVLSYLDATSTSMSYSDDVEFACFSYKRINHFNEWLQQVQAKESFDIPQKIIDDVMEELYARRVRREDITPRKVREILKALKLRKTYEHVVQITSRVTGTQAFKIPPEAEEMCRLMFIAVQPAFDKHCPKDRKNFLSYAYCLYKFFQLLGYDELLDSFTLLKGRDKLQRQDQIWESLCHELGWEFVPT